MQCIRLDQYAFEIQFSAELAQHRPFVGFTGGLAGLADRHTEGGRIERHLGNER
jgi:hypothetical protein